MASALQQQLAVIATDSTHQLDLKAQKAQHSKSLLFEPRDAASQSFDTIYHICLEGFEELCQLDIRFVQFSRNLFSEQSKSEDRTQMNAKENAHLDTLIVRFLGLLGGRLLLQPAVKAAEWLVRRFKVHQYNVEALLLTFLPYHQSHLFTALLSILPEQLPPTFRFLLPYISSRHNPPRHAIIAATINNSALFAAFNRNVLDVARAKHQSAPLLGFWASVTAQAVNGMIDASKSGRDSIRRQKEEDLVLKVLPVLQNALSIKGVPELYLGSCMIMTILTTKVNLSDKVLNAMLQAIASGWTEQTMDEGITCLAVLSEEIEDLSQFPRSVLDGILKVDSSLSIIGRVAASCQVRKLLVGISLGIVSENMDERASKFLSTALKTHLLPENDKLQITKAILSHARLGGTSKSDLLQLLGSFAEQSDGSRLISAAARAENLDIAKLDTKFTLPLLSSAADEDSDEVSIATEDDRLDNTEHQPQLSFDDIPKVSGKHTSFLAPDQDVIFDTYHACFRRAMSVTQRSSPFINLISPLKTTCLTSPTVLSFFARVWCSDKLPAARVQALKWASESLHQAKEQKSVDMQALLPYVLLALSDAHKAVRLAAATVCLRFRDILEPGENKTSLNTDAIIWAKDTLYGNGSTQVHALDSSDMQKTFRDVIIPVLEDCTIDGNYIATTLTNSLNAAPGTQVNATRDLKSGARMSLCHFLASHVVTTPLETVKVYLSAILKTVGKSASTARIQVLLPYIQSKVEHCATAKPDSAGTLLCKALVDTLSHRSTDEIQFLKDLASGEVGDPSLAVLGFSRLRNVWSSMPESTQMNIVDWLLDFGFLAETRDDLRSEASDTLRSLRISSNVLVHLIEDLPSVHELQGQTTPAKKQRTSRISETPKPGSIDKERLGVAVRRMTIILEVIDASGPERHPQLLKALFHLLSELHHYKALLDSELVYVHALVINALLAIVNNVKESSSSQTIERSAIRPDLIVDCVRNTSSVQVHQSALLLMSALATWAPDLVLHSVMPLFTFMSSTILKQSDDYSAHVTDQTVGRIIPPLAASLKRRGKDLITGAADLLLSFTAAFEHIPLHRRSGLFLHLVQTLGPSEALFAVEAMLVERYSDHDGIKPFVTGLMSNFPVAVQLSTVQQYLDLIFDTLKPKRTLADVILGFSEKNKEESKKASGALLDGLAFMLAGETLRKKLAKELKVNDQHAEDLRVSYAMLLEKTLQLNLQLKEDQSLRRGADSVLASLLGIMPSKDFIDSSAKLMQTGADEIRQQVFWSLEQRIRTAKRGDTSLQKVFIDVLPNCTVFVTSGQPVETRLAAIACVDRIADKFGRTDPQAVLQVAAQIAGDAALGSSSQELRRMSLLCLASMIEVLEDEFISILPRTVDKTTAYVREILDADDPQGTDEALLAASFSFATTVLDYVPWMLSRENLERLLLQADEVGNENAKQFLELAARKIGAQEILSAIERTWEAAIRVGESAPLLHLTTLRSVIQHHPKSVIAKNAQSLFSALLHAFDMRRQLQDTDDHETNDELFELVNETVMDAVLKLNDASFRPFFIRASEWTTKGLTKQSTGDRTLRKISFYSFTLTLFDQLKSLVTSYISYVLDDIASIMQSNYELSEDGLELLELVVRVLSRNFSQDQDGFWQSPAHFDIVVGPLTKLLNQARTLELEKIVIPAIVELASAANSPEHHKTIDDILLKFMRHEDAPVRLVAVKAERSLTERLSFDWCNFIPAWLPFIAELQEDDDGAVERETLRWMQQIQDVTGESVNEMLR